MKWIVQLSKNIPEYSTQFAKWWRSTIHPFIEQHPVLSTVAGGYLGYKAVKKLFGSNNDNKPQYPPYLFL